MHGTFASRSALLGFWGEPSTGQSRRVATMEGTRRDRRGSPRCEGNSVLLKDRKHVACRFVGGVESFETVSGH